MGKRLGDNVLFDTIRRINKLLLPAEKRRGLRLVFLTLIGVMIDVVGLATLVPVMMAATNPKFVRRNEYMNWLYELGNFESHSSFMIFLAVALLLVFIAKNGITLLINYWQSRFAFRVATNLARRQYIKYYERGFLYFKETNSADTINNIVNIPNFFASGILISTINFISELAVIAFIVAAIALVNVSLFVALVIVLLPSGFAIYNLTKNKLYTLGKEMIELKSSTYSRLNQAIFGYVDVKLNNKEHHFLDAYVTRQSRLNTNNMLKFLISLIPSRSLEIIAVLGIMIIFLYTFLFSDRPDRLFSFIAVFAAAAFRVLPSMNRLLAALMGIRNHLFALQILEEGDLPTGMTYREVVPVRFKKSIEFRDLTFQYESANLPAVQELSFTVQKGEKIGIVGESGSGKTTLMNILLRFLVEQEGGIYIDGVQLSPEHKPGWRELIGYVQQNVFLMDASLKENVAFGTPQNEINLERVRSALKQASLLSFAETLPQGIETRIGEQGAMLSGGQRQRIGIARALYWNSQVLVFDEATSALDMDTEQAITESIEALSEGQTLFVIAHRITTLRHCDRIIEMKNGRLVGSYTYEELIRSKMG
ncbi:MAG: ABC transporter ATP-binding protein [Bacteroidota bacterium]